jgi:tetratricopeptide (TPR) repeat protein
MAMKLIKTVFAAVLALFLLAGGGLTVSNADAGDTPRRLSPATRHALVKAQEALNQEQYPKAREVLQSYLKDHAREAPADVYWLLGNTFFLEDRLGRACQVYRRGMERFPDNPSLLQNYAIASYLNQDFQEAGDYFRKAYEKAPEEPDIKLLYKAASAYYNAENFRQARQTLERLMAAAEAVQPEWRKLLVYTHVSLEAWDRAERALYPLLAEEPANADFWKLLAKLHLNRDNHKDAASALHIAYEIHPPEPSAWDNLADIYFYLNAPLKASTCITRAYGENLNVEQCEKLARAYAQALRYDQAVRCIDRAIEQEPTAERYQTRARFYYKNRQFQEALASFEKAVEKEPKDAWSRLMMGFCAMEMDRWELAHKAFSAAAKSKQYGSWAQSALALVDDVMDARKAARRSRIKISMK